MLRLLWACACNPDYGLKHIVPVFCRCPSEFGPPFTIWKLKTNVINLLPDIYCASPSGRELGRTDNKRRRGGKSVIGVKKSYDLANHSNVLFLTALLLAPVGNEYRTPGQIFFLVLSFYMP